MAKHISNFTKGRIIECYNQKYSFREISKRLSVSLGSVSRIIKKYNNNESLNRKRGSGRKNSLNRSSKNFIISQRRNIENFNATKVARILKEEKNIEVCAQTVRNFLHSEGFHAYSPSKKPLLLQKHINLRYEICKKWSFLPDDYWNDVLFSDESKFTLFNSDGRSFVWREKGLRNSKEYVKSTLKFGGGSVMVWGCFSSKGFGKLVRIDGIMDKYSYVNILKNNLFTSVSSLGHTNFLFQQDNDPKHTSKYTKEFFLEKNINCIPWPSQSPDLNPIENVWGYIKAQLSGKTFKDKNDLFDKIKNIWENLSIDYAKKLTLSMNKRILECLRNKGSYTSY